MTTKFYLRATTSGVPSGTLPTAEQSTLTADDNFEADQTTNRLLSTTKGAAQTSLANTSIGANTLKTYYMGRWVSPVIYQEQITAQTWSLEYAASESNAAANFPITTSAAGYICAYVWKPSAGTKYGNILDGATGTIAESSTTQTVLSCTFTGAAVTGLIPGDACIVVELWAQVTQGNTTQRTQTIFFDGTTENSTTNEAAFVSTPEDLIFTETADNSTLITASGDKASTANTTEYWCMAGRTNDSHTTEADVAIPIRVAGTLSNLTVKLKANTVTGSSTFTIMKNGSPTSLVATASSTGEQNIEDLTNTVSISAGDKISLKSVPGAATNTYTISLISTMFTPTDTSTACQVLAMATNLTLSSASSTATYPLCGTLAATVGDETRNKNKIRAPGTGQYFFVYVISNARTTDTVFRTRKNAGNGNCTVTFASGETGLKEDTSHSDTLAIDDFYNFQSVTSTGTENLVVGFMGVHFTNTVGYGVLANGGDVTHNANSTLYYALGGGLNNNVTESFMKRRVRMSTMLLKDLFVYLRANTVTADSTATVMVDGVATSIVATLTNATTGLFSDTTHTANAGSNSDIELKIVTGATGTDIRMTQFELWYRPTQIDFSRSISDTSISVSDAIVTAEVLSRSISDTSISVSDDLVRSFGTPRSISDTSISVSDAISRTLGFPKAINEASVSVSDDLQRQETFSRSLSESSISVSDSIARAVVNSRAINEASISVSDSLARVYNAARSISDTAIDVLDSIVRAVTNSRAVDEASISVSDSAARTYNASRAINDTSISMSDSIARAGNYSRDISETAIDVSDDITGVVESIGHLFRDIDETVNVSDQLDREVTNSRAISEPSITVSDDIQRRLDVNRSLSDIVNVSDALTRTLAFFRSLADIITESDSVERLLAFFRTQNEPAINSSDSIDRSVTNSRDINESVSVSDQLTRIYSTTKNIIEASISVADSIDISQTFGIPTLTKKIKNWLFSKYEEDDPAKE